MAHIKRIRIGIYSILNTVIIPPLLVRFKKKHPDIEISSIHGHYQALENSLSKNNLDLIVCVQDKDNPLFDCIHLKREHFLLAIPPEHPACHKAVKMEDLTYPYLDIRELNQDCIFSNIPTNKSAGRKTNCLKSAGFTLRKSKKWKAFSSPSSLLLKTWCGICHGIVCHVLSYAKAPCLLCNGRPETSAMAYHCTSRGLSRDPVVQDCIEIIRELINEQ